MPKNNAYSARAADGAEGTGGAGRARGAGGAGGRFFRRVLLTVAALAALTAAAMPLLESWLEARISAFLREEAPLAPARVEVSLWRRSLSVACLPASSDAAAFSTAHRVETSVAEAFIEGVNLTALVFGTQKASLAKRLRVRGLRHAEPQSFSDGQRGSDTIVCEELDVRGISGAFPGLAALAGRLDAARARAFTRSLRARNLYVRGVGVASGKESFSLGAFACRDAGVYGCGPALLQSLAVETAAGRAELGRALWAELRFVEGQERPANAGVNFAAETGRAVRAGIQAEGFVAAGARLNLRRAGEYSLALMMGRTAGSLENCTAGIAWFGPRMRAPDLSLRYYPELLEGLGSVLSQEPGLSGFVSLQSGAHGFAAGKSEAHAAENSLDIRAGIDAHALGRARLAFRGGNALGEPFPPLPAVFQGWYHLASASLTVEDTGFSQLWYEAASRASGPETDFQPEGLRILMTRILDEALFGPVPARAGGLRRDMDAFLLQGGTLEISLAPEEPISLAQLPEALKGLWEQAGLRHAHTPPPREARGKIFSPSGP